MHYHEALAHFREQNTNNKEQLDFDAEVKKIVTHDDAAKLFQKVHKFTEKEKGK